jgi:MipA family protein
VRIDREGVRGDLFRSERLRLDISAAAAPPTKSDDSARTGMPKLDPAVEIGPALELKLGSPAERAGWSMVLPVRVVIASDLRHAQSLGWVFSPYLRYQPRRVPGAGWEFDISFGPLYAGERYHDYYYQVDPAFVTSTRSAYDARGGYSGSRLTLAASRRFANFWAGAFVRYDSLAGAVFDDSPLVRSHQSFMFGAGVAWIFSRSRETARVPD